MALGELLDSFATEEWIRFTRGIAKLDPEQQRLHMTQVGAKSLQPGETATISIPGWDEIIKLGPRYQPTPAERAEVRAAARQNRAPNASAAAVSAVRYGDQVRERIRTSAQPGYSQAFGEILTAVDNVQDFASTVATLGRLGLWGVERGLNAFLPGSSLAVASEAGRAAARTAQQQVFSAFERGLLEAVKRGEPVAAFLLGDAARLTAARRAAVEAAGKVAYQAAFRASILGLGARVALRLLPIVGWAVLAADLLNILNLLGMLAMPAYAALCQGPSAALAAGVPAVLFKGAMKREAWTMANANPFSRQARAARRGRSVGRLPGVSNLIEVFQTTEQLFGVGITLGGLMGAVMETVFAAERAQRGEATSINFSGASGSFSDPGRAIATPAGRALSQLGARLHQMMGDRVSSQTLADLVKNQQAAAALVTAPAVLGVQETFDDETHLTAMVAYAAALSTLAPLMKGLPVGELYDELADIELTAPWPPSSDTLEWAAFYGHDLDAGRRWWWPGAGRTVTGRDYVAHHVAAIPAATTAWLLPRRNTVEGALYGTLVNAIAEAVWLFLEDDPEFFKWEMTTDFRLMASLLEAGRLVNYADGEAKVWAFWQDARQVIEWKHATSLQAEQWDYIAKRHDMQLIKMLPPGSPWPEEWHEWLRAEERAGILPPPLPGPREL